LKKLRNSYRLIYLILQDETFTWLCLLNVFIKIFFLFNQTIIETDTHIKLIEKNKRKTNYAKLHILEILFVNNYFLF